MAASSTTPTPLIAWNILWKVLFISGAFAVITVGLFTIGLRCASQYRSTTASGPIRFVNLLIAVVAFCGIAYVSFLGIHYILSK